MTRVATPTTLAQGIGKDISFREILEGTQPYPCKLRRRATFQAASTVMATQLAGGDAERVLTVAEEALSPTAHPGWDNV